MSSIVAPDASQLQAHDSPLARFTNHSTANVFAYLPMPPFHGDAMTPMLIQVKLKSPQRLKAASLGLLGLLNAAPHATCSL
jgi:hypothetical protein